MMFIRKTGVQRKTKFLYLCAGRKSKKPAAAHGNKTTQEGDDVARTLQPVEIGESRGRSSSNLKKKFNDLS